MYIIFPLLAATFGLFLWAYSVSYMLYKDVSPDFIERARIGLLRGVFVAGIFVFFQHVPTLQQFLNRDWVIFPVLFFCISLPFSWYLLGGRSILPFGIVVSVWFFGSFASDTFVRFLWSPFHEEIGKWYQSITFAYPAVISPFVSIGFGVFENFQYFSADLSFSQILGRTLFSLPLHIFVTLGAFWVLFRAPTRTLGIILGIVFSITCHVLYNWSLSTSLFITLFLIITGYLFYGWSLEKTWWKEHI